MADWLAAGLNFASGLMNRSAQQDYNAQQLHQAELNRKSQEKFAKEGIRWKVEDAREAGIHPLYALGAQTSSFNNVSLGGVPETGMATGLAAAGQDISRAVNATRTQPEREAAFTKTVRDLEVVNMGLKNELLATQVAKLKSGLNPPLPTLGDTGSVGEFKKPGDTLWYQNTPISTDPRTSNVEDYQTRYGEPAEWFMAAPTALADAKKNKVDAVSVITQAYRWLDKHADPQFGPRLLQQLMERR